MANAGSFPAGPGGTLTARCAAERRSLVDNTALATGFEPEQMAILPLKFRTGLLLALAVAGCSVATTTDASVADASVDAGHDGGYRDGGPPVFDTCDGAVVSVVSGDGERCGCTGRESCWGAICTLKCAPCSEASPCPNGGACQYISIPDCIGECVYSMDPCDGGTVDVGGAVELVSYDCTPAMSGSCLWRSEFDSTRNTVRCSVIVGDSIPDSIDLGLWDAGRSTSWQNAAAGAICRSTADFVSPDCLFDANAEVRVRLDAGTRTAQFAYGTSEGLQPTSEFRALVRDVRSSCRAAFKGWDGGRYPFVD